jgi:lipopolysaccharide export system permease protein
MMPTLFDRYIGIVMLKATGMTLAVVTVLLVVFGLVDELEDVGQGAYRMSDAFLVAMMSAPRFVFEGFPVAALVGSLVGLGAMASHGELVAMRSAGYSLRQIILAVVKAGALMMLAVFLFGEFVAPAAEQWGERHRAEKLEQQVTLKTRYGFWARDGSAFVNIRTILPGSLLGDIYIYEFDEAGHLTLATRAERAEYRGSHWQLFGIAQSQIEETGVISREVDEARWDSLLDPGLLNAIVVQPTMLRVDELWRYILVLRDNGQSATEYEVAFWVKVATPFATLVMLFIAIPFVLVNERSSGLGQRVFLGVLLGMGFYMLSRAMSYVAVVYDLSPAMSALLPGVAFLAVGVVLLRRVQ